MVVYGCHLPSITYPFKGNFKVQVVEDDLEELQEVMQILKDDMAISKNRMKKQAD